MIISRIERILFQHTAARRRLALPTRNRARRNGFNTQPPEGGWMAKRKNEFEKWSFNTQPPEGGWLVEVADESEADVSTRSRPKAAGEQKQDGGAKG